MVLYTNGRLAEIDTIEPTTGGATTIAAGAGNDVILGGAGQNTITATTGNEVIVAGNGQVLYSGALMTGVATTYPSTGGNDTINGGNGNDIILGGDGTDQITVGSGNNFILAHDGQVALSQGQVTSIATTNSSFGGNDSIVSGSGNDVILAGPGNASIAGGTGNDIIIGGDGQVLFSQGKATLIATTDSTGGDDVIAAGTGKDIVIAGAGTDRISGGNGNGIILGGLGTITLVAGSATSITSTVTTLGGNDVIVSGTGNDVVIGGHGNDTIVDAGGNNVLIAGLGKVTMSLGQVTSAATIASTGGNTSITGGNGNDIMLGGSGNDTLTGGRGNEVILGGNGQVVANSGSNVFAQAVLISASPTLGGNDTITGGAGNNVLVGGSGTDQIYGGGGNDVIFGSNARIALPAISAASLASINTTAAGPAGVHIIHAGKGKDTIYGGPGDNQIFGGPGASYFNGGTTVTGARSGYDVIQGGTGVSTFAMGFPAGVPAAVRPAVNFQVSTDFSTGVPAPFTGRSGSWLPAAGKYQASSSSAAISTFTLNVSQASYVELQVTLSGTNAAGLVFNYQSASNYDFAELNPSTSRLTIGHVSSGVVFTDAVSTVSVARGSTPTLAARDQGPGRDGLRQRRLGAQRHLRQLRDAGPARPDLRHRVDGLRQLPDPRERPHAVHADDDRDRHDVLTVSSIAASSGWHGLVFVAMSSGMARAYPAWPRGRGHATRIGFGMGSVRHLEPGRPASRRRAGPVFLDRAIRPHRRRRAKLWASAPEGELRATIWARYTRGLAPRAGACVVTTGIGWVVGLAGTTFAPFV